METAHQIAFPLPATFVVRLYRLDGARAANIAGIVEDVASGHQSAFRNARELLALLNPPRPRRSRATPQAP
ncbi:MAG: hypothetical protein IPO58_12030 [Betaproteobacteria bacterium]|nr:hypothetical protein [Betaproteobacteria bacterium]MBK9607096.1 hypothetical protein [Betaproteobacteria bacterium]